MFFLIKENEETTIMIYLAVSEKTMANTGNIVLLLNPVIE
jgi:hypothetical protein